MSNIFLHPAYVEDAKACGPCRPRIGLVIGKTARGWTNASPLRSCHDARLTHFIFGLRPTPPPGREVETHQYRRPFAWGSPSAADAQTLDESFIALFVLLLDVIEKRAPLRHHFEQAAAGVVVLDMGLEVTGQIGDPLGENRNLHLGRPSVADLQSILIDERGLALGADRHRNIP